MFDFKKTYASWSDEALIEVISNPGNYQPEALSAAKAILAERNITTGAVQQKQGPPEKRLSIDTGFVTKLLMSGVPAKLFPAIQQEEGSIFHEIDTIRHWEKSIVRIRLFAIIFSLLYLISSVDQFTGALAGKVDITSLFVVVIALYPIVCLVLLYMLKQWGWILLAFNLCYMVLFTVTNMLLNAGFLFSVSASYSAIVVFGMLISIAGIVFLYKDRALFRITNNILRNVVIVAVIFCIIVLFMTHRQYQQYQEFKF